MRSLFFFALLAVVLSLVLVSVSTQATDDEFEVSQEGYPDIVRERPFEEGRYRYPRRYPNRYPYPTRPYPRPYPRPFPRPRPYPYPYPYRRFAVNDVDVNVNEVQADNTNTVEHMPEQVIQSAPANDNRYDDTNDNDESQFLTNAVTGSESFVSFEDSTPVLRLFERLNKNTLFFMRTFGVTPSEFCYDIKRGEHSKHEEEKESEHFSLQQAESLNKTRLTEIFEKLAEDRLKKDLNKSAKNLDFLQKIVSGTLMKKRGIELNDEQRNKLFALIALEQMKAGDLMVQLMTVTGEVPQLTSEQVELGKRVLQSKIDFLSDAHKTMKSELSEEEHSSHLRRKTEVNMFIVNALSKFENALLDNLNNNCH